MRHFFFNLQEQASAKSEDEARRQAEALFNDVKAEMARRVSEESVRFCSPNIYLLVNLSVNLIIHDLHFIYFLNTMLKQ